MIMESVRLLVETAEKIYYKFQIQIWALDKKWVCECSSFMTTGLQIFDILSAKKLAKQSASEMPNGIFAMGDISDKLIKN